jgi:carbon monoxide dehydrogenase subunit G
VELRHTFTVPAPIDQAWSTLLDVEGIAPCFPGAALTGVDEDEFSGTVKVKLGPVSLQYAGKGRFLERDEAARRVRLEANGSDRRGNGTAGATVTAQLEPEGDSTTRVVVETDLKVTGRPAQFGRGMLQDVGGKIIDQFATCLAARMAPEPAPAAEPAPVEGWETPQVPADQPEPSAVSPEAEPAPSPSVAGSRRKSPTPRPAPVGHEPIAELDLGSVVLPTLAKRYGPGALAGLIAVLVVWLLRRRAH